MAEEKKIATGYIGNALRSTAADHTTTFADEVFDTERQQYQNEMNTDLEQAITDEVARAQAAELANTTAIEAETTRVEAALDEIVGTTKKGVWTISSVSWVNTDIVLKQGIKYKIFVQSFNAIDSNVYVCGLSTTPEASTTPTIIAMSAEDWAEGRSVEYTPEKDEHLYVRTNTINSSVSYKIESTEEFYSLKELFGKIDDNTKQIQVNTEVIENINTHLPKKNVLVLASFDSHSPYNSSAFNGFATRYSLNGYITKADVFAQFNGSGSIDVTCEIIGDDFETIIASKTITTNPSDESRTLSFDFERKLTLNGNFYIKVYTTGTIGVKNNISTKCTADDIHSNRYKQPSRNIWLGGISNTYCLDVTLYNSNIVIYKESNNVVRVGSFDGADYATIQDAIDGIVDDSPLNRYIIKVYPGVYGKVNMVRDRVRYVSIIGIDRNACIITDNRGDYYNPPFNANFDGTLENMSIIQKSDDEHYSPSSNQTMAYALHSDWVGDRTMIVRNCYFESNVGPAVGLGLHNTKFVFENCEFVSKPFQGTSGSGAFFVHTNVAKNGVDFNGQECWCKNCVAINDRGSGTYRVGFRWRFLPNTTGTYKFVSQNCGSFNSTEARTSINGDMSYLCYGNEFGTIEEN